MPPCDRGSFHRIGVESDFIHSQAPPIIEKFKLLDNFIDINIIKHFIFPVGIKEDINKAQIGYI